MELSVQRLMPYEPGSPQCRILIDCKSQIESMLLSLQRIDNSGHISDQLRSVQIGRASCRERV